MRVTLIRHGQTAGNALGRYVGSTDEPLSPEGIALAEAVGAVQEPQEVYVTPLCRTAQTAAILFPEAKLTVVPGLREMDFGDFEGRSADDMENDAAYRAWVDSWCEDPCPGGECKREFSDRVCEAFVSCLKEAEREGREEATFVVHGGTIMSVLDRFAIPKREYYAWSVKNCKGYTCEAVFEDDALTLINVKPYIPDPSRFIQNRDCKYFPCHKGVKEEEFNCLFCYCPLYLLGPDCGGGFKYLKSGVKSCVGCSKPHGPGGYDHVMDKWKLVAEKIKGTAPQ